MTGYSSSWDSSCGKLPTNLFNKLENALGRLQEYKIGTVGQLLKWEEDYREIDIHHRHFAHLVGFHPFSQIDSETSTGTYSGSEAGFDKTYRRNEV